MDDATNEEHPGHGEPESLASAMSEAVVASVEQPHRFEAVFDRYHRTVYEYLARSVGTDRADEYAGDVFVAAFAARVRYDPARGTVRAWLFGIAANVRHTRSRSEWRGRRAWSRVGGEHEGLAGGYDAVDESLDYGKQLGRVATLLRELSDTDRDVLVLYAWHELTYAEIAQVLGVEVGTVRSRLSRARARLRELLEGSGEVLDGSGDSP